jgi:hypothetical protein
MLVEPDLFNPAAPMFVEPCVNSVNDCKIAAPC